MYARKKRRKAMSREKLWETSLDAAATVRRESVRSDNVIDLAIDVWVIADKRRQEGRLKEGTEYSFCLEVARKKVFGRKRRNVETAPDLGERVWNTSGVRVKDVEEVEWLQSVLPPRLGVSMRVAVQCSPIMRTAITWQITGYTDAARREAMKVALDAKYSGRRKSEEWKTMIWTAIKTYLAFLQQMNGIAARTLDTDGKRLRYYTTMLYTLSEFGRCAPCPIPLTEIGAPKQLLDRMEGSGMLVLDDDGFLDFGHRDHKFLRQYFKQYRR